MADFKLLDCTLRDGAYIVDSHFGEAAIKGIIKKMNEAGADIIECGWLKDKEHEEGSSFFHLPEDVIPYLGERDDNCEYVTMIDWNRYDLGRLPICNGKSIDAIRVVFPHEHYIEGIGVGKEVANKGYKLYFQAANTLAYNNDELKLLAKEVNASSAQSLSVVDTFGAMYEEDLDRIVGVLNEELRDDIAIGFHSHNNQQLAFSNAIHFIRLLKDTQRTVVIDSSLCGMGRGAGNATTELMANYLNRKCGGHYDLNAIMDAIDVYMKNFEEKYTWGYSTEYCIAGLYCCHVNNIAYLTKNHRTSAKDMRNIIESLSEDDRRKYDYDLLEEKYIENQSRKVDDDKTIAELEKQFSDKEVILIAPGKSSVDEKSCIEDYIFNNKDSKVVIAVNALLSEYDNDYDYLFVTNNARYEYAKSSKGEQFGNLKKILLSGIKKEGDTDEYIVNFEKVVKRGWDHFDNAVICALRLMIKLKVKKVSIAGFDGFKESYNASYADESLPTVNPGKEWGELNKEIKDMFIDVKNSAGKMQINFLTDSYFAYNDIN